MRSHHRARKPWAVRRLQLRRRNFFKMDAEIRAIYRHGKPGYDRYGRFRPLIFRPGRFFYCQDCGRRLAPDQTVIEYRAHFRWGDPDIGFCSCLECAIAAGLDVWTRERMNARLCSHSLAEDGVRFYM